VTAVWGSTFVVVKDAIAQYPTVPLLGLRFALALLALAGGYVLQTFALRVTSAGNAGLITGLFAIFGYEAGGPSGGK